ncbi:hypothetical protein XI07_13145 [Bradyrhizobium sp. CCBAU 11445]|uniref:hypothetical protein n=1 Tax=Bradyrhizobium sp. CCBAU 11445 TaxID=1630896 RepID=UPI0023056ED5|nr:hypothetical protein [Bradyrhizobium sp. CCBAU 11445]MDA9482958.1 hypothetical protein [Bradyrhizobium sp. CCBAU 11445]
MNLHQILKTVPKEWHSVATHYVKGLQRAGVPADKLDSLVQWGVAYQGPADEEALLSSFRAQASRLGLESHVTSLAADWGLEAREEINSGKWQPEPVQPDDRDKLLEDIRAYRQQWGDLPPEMERVELEQLEAKLSGKPAAAVTPPASFDGDLRLKEIRQMVRDDPDALTRNPALEREQMALIQAQLAASPAAQPTSQPAPAAMEGDL